jgi:hypothetical protein
MALLESFPGDYATLFSLLLALSVLSIAGAVVGLPMLVLALPADYFQNPENRRFTKRQFGVAGVVLLLLKNTLGLVLLLAGILMLILPGQDMLTIFGGLLLMDFPGKYTLERKLSRQKQISRALNWIRNKGGKPPFQYTA